MARPIHARVSAAALRHNYLTAKQAARYSKVLAVVKANGYGHGIDRVARALAEADGFATLELDGAVRLREARPDTPILLLEGFFDAVELREIAASRLATAVHHEEQLRMLEADRGEPIDLWLKINTGMNRLGFPLEKVANALERLQAGGRARSITLMTHFATSEAPDGVREAMRRFAEVTRGITLPRSLANSAAIFAHPGSHMDAVRLGICLYGATPFADRSAEQLGLIPAMTLESQLISIQELRPGDEVGYGATFRCEKPMRLGVVACGYADGYPRHAPSGTPVLVEGIRTVTAGRVSMDMITVDLTPVPHAKVGSPVTLWGEGLPVDEVATAAGTVGYELLCGVAPRVPIQDAL
ncbi:MAG TPA: alanine racemase [Usitatibacter sp.]|nr:alanine racemase [Usitatibacter sp.]